MELADVATHIAFGAVFAGTGAAVRGMCEHVTHRLAVGFVFVTLEAVVTVAVVG